MIARTNDPEVVRAEYQDESRFAVRATAGANATGPSARDEHRVHGFSVENAEPQLARQFGRIDRRDANGTVTFPKCEAARRYVESSVTRSRTADAPPRFDGPLVCTRLVSVFVGEEPL